MVRPAVGRRREVHRSEDPVAQHLLINYWQPPGNPPARIGVSLSGGGHRAALFAAGALAALIDARLADRVQWIASASGGSLVSGQVAAAGGILASGSADLARCAIEAATAPLLLHRILRRPWAALRPGSLIERRIDRLWLGGSEVRLTSLSPGIPRHVFVAVDLGALAPVYFSQGFVVGFGLDDESDLAAGPGQVLLATAIRASAAFPGLPLVDLPIDELLPLWDAPDTARLVLADGGLWSNLAISWATQGRRLLRQLEPPIDDQELDVDFHLVVDASAEVQRLDPGRFDSLTGWGRGIFRSTRAMLQSTVEAQRRDLDWQSGWTAGRPISHVLLRRSPAEVSASSALLESLGGSKASWLEASKRCTSVPTTLSALSSEDAICLVALGYGLTAAHLTDGWSVPFARFVNPWRTFGKGWTP